MTVVKKITPAFTKNFLKPMLISNLGLGAACVAVGFKSKNGNLKQLGLFAGVTEPGLYGVLMPLKKPLADRVGEYDETLAVFEATYPGHDLYDLRSLAAGRANYNGWANRRMVGFYERYVRTIFARYKDKVKYWLTFNEINSILESPFMSGGICTPKNQLTKQDLYQACHHELVASALATQIAHEMMPGAMVGCMLLSMPVYPLTPAPDDVLACMREGHKNDFFGDVQIRGRYPGYMLRYFRENGIQIHMEPGDEELLQNTVDFVSFGIVRSSAPTGPVWTDHRKRSRCNGFLRLFKGKRR